VNFCEANRCWHPRSLQSTGTRLHWKRCSSKHGVESHSAKGTTANFAVIVSGTWSIFV